jgi:type III secretion system FlhB-like substrate exporter
MSTSPGSDPRRAVALRHERDGADAPRIVATGKGELARQILERALASGIPIHRDPDLVALLSASPLGAEIPPDVYEAVARVLTWLWGLRDPPANEASLQRDELT